MNNYNKEVVGKNKREYTLDNILSQMLEGEALAI